MAGKYCFPFKHGFEHFDILNLLNRGSFNVTVQNNKLCGFSHLNGSGDILQMRLKGSIDRMGLCLTE